MVIMRKRHHLSFAAKRRIIFGISLFIFILLYAFKNFSFTIRAVSMIGFLVIFYITDHMFGVHFKLRHYLYIIIIAVTGFLLSPLYFIYPHYDKILHLMLPILYSSIIFYMVSELKIELKWKMVFTFFIVLGSLGIFEIGEYLLDQFFDLKLQGVFLRSIQGLEKYDILIDRIDDTMIDMVFGVFGATIYAVSTFILLKRKR